MFETFCYTTLAKARFEFIYSDLIEYLNQSLKVCQIESDAAAVLRDLEESVCLIHQEGIKYVFAHRSFQEYFAAKFALRYGGANQFDIINNCIGKHWSNNSTIKMMSEIDEVKFREKWILPALESVVHNLEESKSKPISVRLAVIATELHLNVNDSGNVGPIGISPNEKQLSLFMNVSKACDIPNVLQGIHGRSLVPFGYQSIEEFAQSGDAPESLTGSTPDAPRDVSDGAFSLSVIRLDQREVDLKWLDKTDLVKCFDDFEEQARAALDAVRQRVAAQKALELEVL